MPRWHPVSISGYHIREAGSTAQQELAFTLKDGFTYVERALERGLDVDDFAPRLSFFFNAHIDFFEEIAKYRAARRIWAREMQRHLRRQARGVDAAALPRADRRRLADRAAAAQQRRPHRAARRSPAVLGGTQSLHTNSFDEALALPTEEAVRVALRTQQIIAFESGVAEHRRPARRLLVRREADRRDGGAPPTTTSPASTSWAGWSRRSASNFPQREIADAAFTYQQRARTSASGSSSASTTSSRRTKSRRRSCASTRRSNASRSTASRRPAPRRDGAAVEARPGRAEAGRRRPRRT